MPAFEVLQPTTIAEAVAWKAQHPGSLYVAGGTDLLPNLKHWLHEPSHVISLGRIPRLAGITTEADGTLRIGAMTPLQDVADDATINAEVPGLAAAVGSIAGPQHRRMGTLGGNVMLDTRCLFYNQSREWREAVGYCLKKDGTWCHVIGSGKACVAAQSSDSVPMLVALGATLQVSPPDGTEATMPLVDLFTKDGRFGDNHTLPDGTLLTAIRIPPRGSGHRSVYRKVRSRGGVDFPQLSVALVGSFDERVCTALSIVIGAMLPFPKALPGLGTIAGTVLDDAQIDAIATRAAKQARPQAQIHGATDWRRHLAGVETHRGLMALRP